MADLDRNELVVGPSITPEEALRRIHEGRAIAPDWMHDMLHMVQREKNAQARIRGLLGEQHTDRDSDSADDGFATDTQQ